MCHTNVEILFLRWKNASQRISEKYQSRVQAVKKIKVAKFIFAGP